MITSSFFASPEVLWSAILAGVGAVGTAGARVLHLGHRVGELEEEVEELKGDFKDDLKYLRDRMDSLHTHLLTTAVQPQAPGAPPYE